MKKLHLSLILPILFGLSASNLFAQESETGRIKELYLNGNLLTFDNFGLQYKSQLNNGNFFRIGLTNLSFNNSNAKLASPSPIYDHNSTNMSGQIEIGLERRKQITERLTGFYGINFITSTTFERNKWKDPTQPRDLRCFDNFSISPGLGFNSGFIFQISRDFSLSAEIMPKFIFTYSSTEKNVENEKVKDIYTGESFNLENSVRVSLIYRWRKN